MHDAWYVDVVSVRRLSVTYRGCCASRVWHHLTEVKGDLRLFRLLKNINLKLQLLAKYKKTKSKENAKSCPPILKLFCPLIIRQRLERDNYHFEFIRLQNGGYKALVPTSIPDLIPSHPKPGLDCEPLQ